MYTTDWDDRTVSLEKQMRFTPYMSNWLSLSKFIRTVTEEDVDDMIIMELHRKKRLEVLHRLLARKNTIRRDREKLFLMKAAYIDNTPGRLLNEKASSAGEDDREVPGAGDSKAGRDSVQVHQPESKVCT